MKQENKPTKEKQIQQHIILPNLFTNTTTILYYKQAHEQTNKRGYTNCSFHK